MPGKNTNSRTFMFTLNNPVAGINAIIKSWLDCGDVVFVTWQKEKGAAGTEHVQGYVVTQPNPKSKSGYSIKWCKENLNGKAHWEARKGTHKQAVDYCNKKDTRIDGPWTIGAWKDEEENRAAVGERHKESLADVKKAIDNGATDEMLWEQHFALMTRYGNNFKNYQLVKQVGERKQPYIFFFWGEPKCGKSARAKTIGDRNGGAFWWNSSGGDRAWFDGYNPAQHKVVVLDDFRGNIPYTMLLKMLDRYPLQVEVKGNSVAFNPNIIIITSNIPANQWYHQDNPTFDNTPLLRRLAPPFGHSECMKKDPNFVQSDAEVNELPPPLNEDIIYMIEKGDLHDMWKKETKEAIAAPPTIDLTQDELQFWTDREEAEIARAEQASLAMGDYEETDSYEFASEPDLGEGAQPGGAVSITSTLHDKNNELERDEVSPRWVSARTLRRTDSDQLAFMTPLHKAGMWKKVGPEPVQTLLSFRKAQENKKRRIMVPMNDNNDDDGDE